MHQRYLKVSAEIQESWHRLIELTLLAFQIVNKIQSMSRFFIVSSFGGKRLHNSTLKATAGNCTPMSSLGQIKPLCKVIELNSSQDFSLVKLYPIKSATNEDSLSFPFGFAFWRKWELLKKHFIYLQLRSQLQPLEGFHPRQESSPAGGSFRGKEQVKVRGPRPTRLPAGASIAGTRVSSQQNVLALHRYGLCFWRNAPVSTWKTMQYHVKHLVWSYCKPQLDSGFMEIFPIAQHQNPATAEASWGFTAGPGGGEGGGAGQSCPAACAAKVLTL